MFRTRGDLVYDDLNTLRSYAVNLYIWVAAWKYDVAAWFQKWYKKPVEPHWDRQKHIKTCEKLILSDLNMFSYVSDSKNSLKVIPSRVCMCFLMVSQRFPTHNLYKQTVRHPHPIHCCAPPLRITLLWSTNCFMMICIHKDHIYNIYELLHENMMLQCDFRNDIRNP